MVFAQVLLLASFAASPAPAPIGEGATTAELRHAQALRGDIGISSAVGWFGLA